MPRVVGGGGLSEWLRAAKAAVVLRVEVFESAILSY